MTNTVRQNAGDTVIVRPAYSPTTGERGFIRDPNSQSPVGTKFTKDTMNHLLSMFYAGYDKAGIDETSREFGDPTLLIEMIEALSHPGFTQRISGTYTMSNATGPQPLLRDVPQTSQHTHATFISDHDISSANNLRTADFLLDVDNSTASITRNANDSVEGSYYGRMRAALYAVNAAGIRGAQLTGANLSAARGKDVYLVFTTNAGGSPGFCYSWIDPIRVGTGSNITYVEGIHEDQRWQARKVGRVVHDGTDGTALISFNTLTPDTRLRSRPIILSPKGGGETGLDADVVFEEFTQLHFIIRNRENRTETVTTTPESFKAQGVSAAITSIGSRERQTFGTSIDRAGNNRLTVRGGSNALIRVNGIY